MEDVEYMENMSRAASRRRYPKEDRNTPQTSTEEAAPDGSCARPQHGEGHDRSASAAGASKELDRKPERKGSGGTA